MVDFGGKTNSRFDSRLQDDSPFLVIFMFTKLVKKKKTEIKRIIAGIDPWDRSIKSFESWNRSMG